MQLSFRQFSIIILVSLIVSSVFFCRFYKNHLDIPNNCDEFGYLMMAEGISNGDLFKDHIPRQYNEPLSDYLKLNEIQFEFFTHMLSAYAYHNDRSTNKIINQYPPGTSLLLAPFKKVDRKVIFPFVSAFILCISLLFAFTYAENQFQLKHIILCLAVCILFLMSAPFLKEFARISSVAPTFGLVLAAGIVIRKNLLLAVALISFSCLFRIANVILLVPLAIYYFYVLYNTKNLKSLLQQNVIVYFLLGGILYYFTYVFILLGNPFQTTYSAHDVAGTGISELFNNVGFYISIDQKWFILQLLVLIALSFMFYFKKLKKDIYLLAISLFLCNYAFFISHQMTIPYYPYASSLILLGIVLSILSESFKIRNKYTLTVTTILIMILSTVGLLNTKNLKKSHRSIYDKEVQKFEKCFNNADIIWSDIGSTSIEYALSKPGFKYFGGSPKSSKLTVSWLNKNGYDQAFWLSDLQIGRAEIESVLLKNDYSYSHQKCQLGEVIIIKAAE